MPVPKTKKELIQQSQKNYQRLINLISSFSESKKTEDFKPGTMNRNIRDVVGHLYHWHLMFLDWYKVGMKGEKPEMPAKGYTWKDTKALNRFIWEHYQDHGLTELLDRLKKTHSKVMKVIDEHTDEELFEKKRYAWTGTSSLATYIRSNTLSHYNWAYKLILKAQK